MNPIDAVERYLRDLGEIRSTGAGVPETSYYDGGWSNASVLLRVYAKWMPSQADLVQDPATQAQPNSAMGTSVGWLAGSLAEGHDVY